MVLSRTDGTAAQRHRQLTEARVDAACREGNLRLSVIVRFPVRAGGY